MTSNNERVMSVTTTLRGLQRCLPADGSPVVINREIFDEIVEAVGIVEVQRERRAQLLDEFLENATATERKILQALYDAGGVVVATEKFRMAEETLWVHVRRLRVKIENLKAPFRVETVRSRGYRLVWVEGNPTHANPREGADMGL